MGNAASQILLSRSLIQLLATVGAQGGSTRYGTIYGVGHMDPAGRRIWTAPALGADAIAGGTDSFNDFQFMIVPTLLGQNWIKGVRVQDQTGAYRNYDPAAAFYTNAPGFSSWEWGTGSNPVWAGGAVGLTYNVEVW